MQGFAGSCRLVECSLHNDVESGTFSDGTLDRDRRVVSRKPAAGDHEVHERRDVGVSQRGIDGVEVLATMASRDCFFGLDIGTRAGDLAGRQLAGR